MYDVPIEVKTIAGRNITPPFSLVENEVTYTCDFMEEIDPTSAPGRALVIKQSSPSMSKVIIFFVFNP